MGVETQRRMQKGRPRTFRWPALKVWYSGYLPVAVRTISRMRPKNDWQSCGPGPASG